MYTAGDLAKYRTSLLKDNISNFDEPLEQKWIHESTDRFRCYLNINLWNTCFVGAQHHQDPASGPEAWASVVRGWPDLSFFSWKHNTIVLWLQIECLEISHVEVPTASLPKVYRRSWDVKRDIEYALQFMALR